jgi:hypothetical protein
MSRSSVHGAVLFNTESAWAEDSSTYGSRLAITEPVDLSGFDHSKVRSNRTVQYMQERTPDIKGVMGGTFRTPFHIPGHGSTTAGAVTLQEHEYLLGYVVGNSNAGGSGTTVNDTDATATVLPVAAASGLAAGQAVFVGSLGDAGGSGQSSIVSTHAANDVTLLVGLPAAPANTNVVYGAAMIYPTETPSSASVQPLRFALLTANRTIEAHGCFPRSLQIDGTNPNETWKASVEWGCSWWEESTETFPTTTSVDVFNPAPSSAGSLFIAERGTATRSGATYVARSFKISVDLGITPTMGPEGVNAYQSVIGAVRGPQVVTVEVVVDTGSASATPTWPVRWDTDDQAYHLHLSANGAATGKRISLYLPNARLCSRRPVQFADGGINRERLVFEAGANTAVTTSELTLSSWRLGLG